MRPYCRRYGHKWGGWRRPPSAVGLLRIRRCRRCGQEEVLTFQAYLDAGGDPRMWGRERDVDGGDRREIERPTDRELEVLRTVREIRPQKNAAHALGISEGGLEKSLAETRRRLGVRYTDEAIALALRRGWLKAPRDEPANVA